MYRVDVYAITYENQLSGFESFAPFLNFLHIFIEKVCV